jgi:hypothetical protein
MRASLRRTPPGPRPFYLALALALALGMLGPPLSAGQEPSVLDLYTVPGRIVARSARVPAPGQAPAPLEYVVEEVAVPPGVDVQPLGGPAGATVAWRLTVYGGPFRVGAQPWVVWIGDRPFAQTYLSPDGTALVVLLFDRALLTSGATVSVSYGLAPAAPPQRLPDPLLLPGA